MPHIPIIKKRAEPAFTSAEVRHTSKSCSRGRFYAISYTLKKLCMALLPCRYHIGNIMCFVCFICFICLWQVMGLRPAGAWVTRPLCGRGNALRWGLGIRGIGATRPLCGIQRGGNRKSQGALARLCEFPGISPPKSPKNPITPIETSRDTLHPGTGVTTRTNRPAGRVRGLGYEVSGLKRRLRNQERFAP